MRMARDNVKFTGNSVVVMMATIKVDENFTNAVKVIKIPSTESSPETTKVINLNKVERRFTFTGYLSNGKLDATETHTTAIDKKDALTTMFGLREVITVAWEGSDIDMAIDKYEISYKSMDDKDTTQDGVAVYNCIISGVVGEDIV